MVTASASAATEKTTFFSLAPAAHALAMTAGPDGNLWFAGFRIFSNSGGEIGRVTPTGQATEFPLPAPAASNSGELAAATAIASGPDGNLWFTEERANKIGQITPSGEITEFPLPGAANRASAITVGPDGNLWFTEEAADEIGRITPSGTVAEFPLPNTGSLPRAITVGPDGNLWFTEEGADEIGRITPSGEITQFPVLTKRGTEAIASGPAGDVWFTAGSEIGSISPSGQTVQPSCLAIGGCKVPVNTLALGPEGDLWFGAGERETEGGGGSATLALNAPGSVGKFFPPLLAVAIGPRARSVAGHQTDLRLSCTGDAGGSECDGVLRLRKRIAVSSSRDSRDTEGMVLGQRRYKLVSGQSERVPLRLTQRAVVLLSEHGSLSVRASAGAKGSVEALQSVVLRQRARHRRGPET